MKLRKMLARCQLGFVAILLLVCFAVLGVFISKSIMENIFSNATDTVNLIGCILDGDEVEEYANGKPQDARYDEIYSSLQQIKEYTTDIKYLYIFKPEDDKCVYFADVYYEGEEGTENGLDNSLGFVESWDMLSGARELYETGIPSDKFDIMVAEYGFTCTVYGGVYGADGELKAIAAVDYDMTKVIQSIIATLVILFVVILVLSVIVTYAELNLMTKRFIEPMALIGKKASGFAGSEHGDDSYTNYLLEEKPNSENEIDVLAITINEMMRDIDRYIKDITSITAEKERIGAELNVATKIQADMLPRIFPAFPDIQELDLFASMDPAKEVGGDFYDFFPLDSTRIALVIADVSGKGVPAALFMVISKTLIKTRTLNGGNPAEILAAVNNQLCEGNDELLFCTCWLGILDIETGHVIAANAGHEYPALMSAGGNFSLIEDQHGLALGCLENVSYENYEFDIEKGGKLFVYTDGVPEATNIKEELFTEERLVKTLNELKDKPVEEILIGTRAAVDDFVAAAPQFDDLTMLAVEYKGK